MKTSQLEQRIRDLRNEALSHIKPHEATLKEPRLEAPAHLRTNADILPEAEREVADDIQQLENAANATLDLDHEDQAALLNLLWLESLRTAELAISAFLLKIFVKITVYGESIAKDTAATEINLAFEHASQIEMVMIKLLDHSKKLLWHHMRIPFLANNAIEEPPNSDAILHEDYIFDNLKKQYLTILGCGRKLVKIVHEIGLEMELPEWTHDVHHVADLGKSRFEAPYDSSTFHVHADKEESRGDVEAGTSKIDSTLTEAARTASIAA